MHIPDGYLGPATCGVFYAVMLPIWTIASRIVQKTLKARQVPMLAIGAAFSFVIMMFNLPVPGGSSGHATGGVLVAVLLGPWAACIAITVALVVQALYCPYGLNVALPAMLGGHLLVFGWVEAIVTALVIKYLQKQAPELLEEGGR
ncbi:MAG TPA: energy-coupling factor ABC transporter permease [Candidatus Omnitrophota bacterium]|nr:energy-coupling factor ABC transporter permease [Candidatus Omnitrophota bacterium]